jgi:DoxX-like family
MIAGIWVVNGLFCKLLNLVPRHQLIVERILGNGYAGFLTKAIGLSEVLMAAWILCGIKTRMNATIQIILIATMNIIEFFHAQDLLLFGKLNLLLALFLIAVIYYNEFVLNKKLTG